jgi:hypothetical protein
VKEFRDYRQKILDAGIWVGTYKQQAPDMPDSCFPNNWFSTHREHIKGRSSKTGLFVIYPMKAPSREKEKNPRIISEIGK